MYQKRRFALALLALTVMVVVRNYNWGLHLYYQHFSNHKMFKEATKLFTFNISNSSAQQPETVKKLVTFKTPRFSSQQPDTRFSTTVKQETNSTLSESSLSKSNTSIKVLGPNQHIDYHNYNYIHKPVNACSPNIELVICTPTLPKDVSLRQMLREKRKDFLMHSNARLIFFIGVLHWEPNKRVQELVSKEAERHGDIVQESYIDSYYNLTLKSMSIAKWVSEYCSSAKFVIKSDADVFIKPINLLAAMKRQYDHYQKFIIGNLVSKRISPNRNPKSKWYISEKEFPGKYPIFVLGPTYGYTVSVAPLIFRASREIPFFKLEDVFLGMCAEHMHIHVLRDNLFTYIHKSRKK